MVADREGVSDTNIPEEYGKKGHENRISGVLGKVRWARSSYEEYTRILSARQYFATTL